MSVIIGNQEQAAPNSESWLTVSGGEGNAQGVGILRDGAGVPILRYTIGNNTRNSSARSVPLML